MKQIIFSLLLFSSLIASGQDFNKSLADARGAYSGGNLEDARFAMQQMLNEIDVLVGKELLKSLPAKFDARAANTNNDNVTANTGLAGVVVHRDYGTGEKTATLDIMTNSPLLASINAILSLPFVGNSGDGSQKVIKVQGYKSILQRTINSETNKTSYSLQIPLNSTLITINGEDCTDAEITRWANLLPMSEIAKLVQ